MNKLYNKIIISLLPIYLDKQGDSTKVLALGESFNLNYQLKTVLKHLGKIYMLDLKEVKKFYGKFLLNKNLVPLAFDKNNIFIPIKTRLPKFKNDRAFGYINLDFIDHLQEEGRNCLIHLADGRKIISYSRLTTVKSHIRNGNIVRECYVERDMARSNTYRPAGYKDLDLILGLLNQVKNFL